MKKILKTTILVTSISSSLFGHGQPDNVFGMSTILTFVPTLYVTKVSRDKTPQEKKRAEVQQFIEENRESLEVEVAQGEGEKVDTLATLYDVKEKASWKSSLQENYEKIFYKKDDTPKSSFEISGELTIFVEKI